MHNEPDSLCQRVELNIYDRLIKVCVERDADVMEMFETFKLTHRFKKCEMGEEYTGRESRILVKAYHSTINNYKYGRNSLP